jgi:hypothetical protein
MIMAMVAPTGQNENQFALKTHQQHILMIMHRQSDYWPTVGIVLHVEYAVATALTLTT